MTRLPLNLPGSPGLRELRAADPLAFLALNRPWVPRVNHGQVREPLSGVTYPRVPGGSAALNAALQDRQLRQVVHALDCRSRLERPGDEGPEYTMRARLTLQGRRLVSLAEETEYYCGSAHPGAFHDGVILDRQTGRSVAPRALWPGLTPARLRALYGSRATGPQDCRELYRQPDLTFTAYLTPPGLAVTPAGLPHVAYACAETVVLPWARLRAYADPKGTYFQDLYPR